jgi:hypothetical protein
VISNCTGRPVFFWTTTARDRTQPPTATSSTFNAVRSQARNLLLTARLNMARSGHALRAGAGFGSPIPPSASGRTLASEPPGTSRRDCAVRRGNG